MTRKDYVAFANALSRLRRMDAFEGPNGDASVTLKAVENELCSIFAADNSNFARERFLRAAGSR